MCLKLLFYSIFIFGISVISAYGQNDTLLHFNGLNQNSYFGNKLNHFDLQEKKRRKGDFLIMPLPTDTLKSVACFYPILILGDEQIASYYSFSTDNELDTSKVYSLTIDLGLISSKGYYPESVAIWIISNNVYGERNKQILTTLTLNNLCDNKVHRIVKSFSVPFRSNAFEIGGAPLTNKAEKNVNAINELFANMIFCSHVESLQDIPKWDAPLIYIQEIIITLVE